MERAAALGSAFDDAVITTPDELATVLAVSGPDVPCVAVTGVPTRGGRLGAVLRQILAAGPTDLQVLLDLREPAGSDLVEGGAPALRGLVPVDCVELWGVPCLRLRRAERPDGLPDLAPWREALLDGAAGGDGPDSARALSAQFQTGPLRDRITELEREVDELKGALEVARAAADSARTAERAARSTMSRLQTSRLAKALLRIESLIRRGSGGSSPMGRLIRALVAAVTGVVILTVVAVVVAELTDTGYVGGAATAAVGLLGVLTASVWWLQFRLLTRLERTAKRVQERILTDGTTLKRHAKLERDIAAQQKRLKEIEHDLAIIAASTTDIAQTVARQRADWPGDEVGRPRNGGSED